MSGDARVDRRRIALFLGSLAGGGAERNLLLLARAFAGRGHDVDLVLGRDGGPLRDEVPAEVRVVVLGEESALATLATLRRLPLATLRAGGLELLRAKPRVVRHTAPLARYLAEARPASLLTTITKNGLVALFARDLAGPSAASTRVVLREASTFSREIGRAGDLGAQTLTRLARLWYPRADAVVAVSQGVADDLVASLALPAGAVHVIRNPVDLRRIDEAVKEPLDDAWFEPGAPPVVIAVGRLAIQKDYPMLLRAFAGLDRDAPSSERPRLMVLGDGPLRQELEGLAASLGIAERVRFAGFVANPWAVMARARALALSSAWEGFPNVLLEALACGCPVVSTDCPSGPAEIVTRAELGRLSPVGDAEGFGRALADVLSRPRESAALRAHAESFGVAPVAERYLGLLLGESPPQR